MEAELAEKPDLFQPARDLPRRFWNGFVNALTPAKCLCCGETVQEAASVCVSCWQELRLIDSPLCDKLGTPFDYDQGAGALSAAALTNPPVWDKARAAVLFGDQAKTIVHRFKYGDRAEAGLLMARMMLRAGRDLLAEVNLIVPVPLHWTRLWNRRFNQAAFLAQKLGKASGKRFDPAILKRSRRTPSQVGLDREDRAKNVRRAFVVAKPERIKGKCVLLVDDVRTTGATTASCAEALKKAGAAQIYVLTFALVNQAFRPHIDAYDKREAKQDRNLHN